MSGQITQEEKAQVYAKLQLVASLQAIDDTVFVDKEGALKCDVCNQSVSACCDKTRTEFAAYASCPCGTISACRTGFNGFIQSGCRRDNIGCGGRVLQDPAQLSALRRLGIASNTIRKADAIEYLKNFSSTERYYTRCMRCRMARTVHFWGCRRHQFCWKCTQDSLVADPSKRHQCMALSFEHMVDAFGNSVSLGGDLQQAPCKSQVADRFLLDNKSVVYLTGKRRPIFSHLLPCLTLKDNPYGDVREIYTPLFITADRTRQTALQKTVVAYMNCASKGKRTWTMLKELETAARLITGRDSREEPIPPYVVNVISSLNLKCDSKSVEEWARLNMGRISKYTVGQLLHALSENNKDTFANVLVYLFIKSNAAVPKRAFRTVLSSDVKTTFSEFGPSAQLVRAGGRPVHHAQKEAAASEQLVPAGGKPYYTALEEVDVPARLVRAGGRPYYSALEEADVPARLVRAAATSAYPMQAAAGLTYPVQIPKNKPLVRKRLRDIEATSESVLTNLDGTLVTKAVQQYAKCKQSVHSKQTFEVSQVERFLAQMKLFEGCSGGAIGPTEVEVDEIEDTCDGNVVLTWIVNNAWKDELQFFGLPHMLASLIISGYENTFAILFAFFIYSFCANSTKEPSSVKDVTDGMIAVYDEMIRMATRSRNA